MIAPSFAVLGVALALAAQGQDAREAEMFGEAPATSSTTTTTTTAAPVKTATAAAKEDALFGDREGGAVPLTKDSEVEDRLQASNDKLAVGGMLYLRFEYDIAERGDLAQYPIRSPNLLDVYLDARPTDRLRAYARARLLYDPTISSSSSGSTMAGAAMQPAQASQTLLFFSQQQQLEVLLDQLWLKLDIGRTVFVTLGRQRIKWGSGHTWNPTDFLNRERKNPLDIFDQRTGVNLVKVHLPLEKLGWNFYAIGTLDESAKPEDVGGAFRAEVLINQTELAAGAAVRKDRPMRLGFDISSAIWDFDVHSELALLHEVTSAFWKGELVPEHGITPDEYSRKDDWIPQLVIGADIQLRYSEEDNVILGAEYFFNDAGYADEQLYPWLIYKGDFTPFYMGRHYASIFALLAGPGSWDNTTFLLSGISNLSDGSVVLRLDYQVKVLTQLRLNLFGMWHTGSLGEMRFGLEVAPIPVLIPNGISVPPPLFEVGGGLQLDL